MIQVSGAGELSRDTWILFIAVALVGNLIFVSLVISKVNLRFKDPSMTFAQILYSGFWGLIGVLSLYEARALVLMLYFPSFMFGSLKLSRLQYIRLAFSLSSLLAAGIIYEYHYLRPDMNLSFQILLWVSFSLLLVWFALFGSYINVTRRNLRLANVELEQAKSELSATSRELKQASESDYLTGILNRRAFYDIVDKEISHGEGPYTIILQDVDHFKQINDEFGHATGDEVLIEIVKLVQQNLGPNDVFVRWGGEEFLILLRGYSFEDATATAEKIRSDFEQCLLEGNQQKIAVTLSQGLCQVESLDNFPQIIHQADKLLYQAKALGRNRIESSLGDSTF